MRYANTEDIIAAPYPFGRTLTGSKSVAIATARELADANGAPVAVWARDGWHTLSELPSDCLEPSPESQGWREVAIVDPTEVL